MQGIYNCIPKTNHVSRVYSVAAVLYVVCAACNVISHMKYVLCLYISTSPSLCAVPNMTFFVVP